MQKYISTMKEIIGTYERFALSSTNPFANAIIQHSVSGINRNPVHRLFSRGELVAEITEYPDKPMKIWVADYTLTEDRSYGKTRVHRIEELVKCFLEKYGYPNCGYADHVKFMPREKTIEKVVEKIVEKPIEVVVEKEVVKEPAPGHWVKNSNPRNPESVWYTCSACGKLADADNNVDILSDYCPHCGAKMMKSECVDNAATENKPAKTESKIEKSEDVHKLNVCGRKVSIKFKGSVTNPGGVKHASGAEVDGTRVKVEYITKKGQRCNILGRSIKAIRNARDRGYKFILTPIAEAA